MSGFITIERAIWDHHLFAKEPMSEREAWMWMLAQAAWKDTTFREDNDTPRGSFWCGIRDLQSVFMWRSDKRVRGFLSRLEKEGMIARKTDARADARRTHKRTHVTICKYDEYQSRGRTSGRGTDARADALKNNINNKQEDTNVSSRAEKPKPMDILSQILTPETAAAFCEMRSKLRAPLTIRAAENIAKKLQSAPDPEACANLSIENGWKGVFPENRQLQVINGGQANGRQFANGPDSGTDIRSTARRAAERHAARNARAGGH